MSEAPKHYCAFCGKSEDDVAAIVVSHNPICICDECVEACTKVIFENNRKNYLKAYGKNKNPGL